MAKGEIKWAPGGSIGARNPLYSAHKAAVGQHFFRALCPSNLRYSSKQSKQAHVNITIQIEFVMQTFFTKMLFTGPWCN